MKRVRLPSLRFRHAAIVPVAGLLTALGLFALPGTASAATSQADQILAVQFPVLSGNLFLKNINTNVAVGSGTLAVNVDLSTITSNSASFTATLTLPPPTVSFKPHGDVAVDAVIAFIQDGPATGQIDLNTGAVTSTANVTVKVLSMKINGVAVPVGNDCQSVSPTTVTLNSQPGFNPIFGGDLAATFTIPQFDGKCQAATSLIGNTIPGSGNTITLTLGELQFA